MRTALRSFYTTVCLLALFSFLGTLGSAYAGGLREQFEGKTITILHGSSVGGGYDLIARAFARFIPEYLPGKPGRVLIQPRPGGGPFRVNSLRPLIKAKPDGLTIGYAYSAWILAEVLGVGPKDFGLKQLRPLGTPLGGFSEGTYVTRRELATSWEDAEKLGRPIKWGGIAPGVGGHLIAAPWLTELGAPIKIIWGYGGSSEMTAAFRRGETELVHLNSLMRDYPKWAKANNIAPLYWTGPKATPVGDARLKRQGLKRPPHVFEIAKRYDVTDWQKNAYRVGEEFARLSKVFFVPAGVSKEVLEVWRQAFRKIVEDPRFAKAVHPRYREELSVMYAEEVDGVLDAAQGLGPNGRKMLKLLVTGER